MVAVEGGSGLLPLARYAMRFAAPDAALRLVSVACNPRLLFPLLTLDYADWCDAHVALVRAGDGALADATRHIEQPGFAPEVELIDLSVHGSSAAVSVSRAAEAWGADLVAVAAYPRDNTESGMCRLDPEALAGVTRCPVLYVPLAHLEAGEASLSRVLVAVDGSDTAMEALCVAMSVVPPGMQLRVVHVVDRTLRKQDRWPYIVFVEDGMRILERATTLLKACGCTSDIALLQTSAEAQTIPEVLAREADRWGADLVVMGTHGRHVIRRWPPGGVARRTLRGTARAVLVCPPGCVAAHEHEAVRQEDEATGPSADADTTAPPVFL